MNVRLLTTISALTALLGGCGDDDDDVQVDGDGDADADADGDGDASWEIHVVDDDDAAAQTSLAVSAAGEIGIAYYKLHYNEGPGMCPEGDPPGPEFHFPLRFAFGQPGAMTVEQVDDSFFVVETRGVTLRYDGDTPNLVAMSGAIEPTRLVYCGANDLHRFTRSGGAWTSQLVVADSGETAPSEDELCDPGSSTFGWVVGVWPSIAFDGGGRTAIVWRDIHSGNTLQHDDEARSDLEASVDGATEMVDCGTGAGDYSALAFEPSGGLVATWYTTIRAAGGAEAREGVWVGRRGAGAWDAFRLHQGQSAARPSIAVAPDGTVGVVWYQDQALKYASIAPGQSLSQAVIETASPVSLNAGRHSSIAFTADGTAVVAHYRCNRFIEGDPGCDALEDAPVLSHRADGVWKTETFEEDTQAICGDYTQVAVLPDGRIVIAYTCQVNDPGNGFPSQLKLAVRSAL